MALVEVPLAIYSVVIAGREVRSWSATHLAGVLYGSG
jgi:hypothetical protein